MSAYQGSGAARSFNCVLLLMCLLIKVLKS